MAKQNRPVTGPKAPRPGTRPDEDQGLNKRPRPGTGGGYSPGRPSGGYSSGYSSGGGGGGSGGYSPGTGGGYSSGGGGGYNSGAGPNGGSGAGSIITAAPAVIPFSAPQSTATQILQENAQVVTNTTTVPNAGAGGAWSSTTTQKTIGSVLTGVSIIPYMRSLAIDFLAYKLRPNRELWFYFDNVGVNKFIQRPNIVEVNTPEIVNDLRSGPQRSIRIGGSTARILHTERSLETGNTIFYVSEFTSPEQINVNNSLTVTDVSYNTTVIKYHHNSGILQSNTSNIDIVLSADANATTDNYYNGNTITILNGTNAGQSAEIISYNCFTRTAYVQPDLKINPKESNLIYTIGDYRTWYYANTYPSSYSTSRGIVSGVLHIPDPVKNPDAAFRTGDKIFSIVDNPYYVVSHPEFGSGTITTRAQYRFVANGLDQSKSQIIENITVFNPPEPSPTPTPTGTPRVTPTNTATPVSGTPARTPTPTSTPDPTPPITGGPAITPTPSRTRPRILPTTPTPTGTRLSDTPARTPPKTPSKTMPKEKCTPQFTKIKTTLDLPSFAAFGFGQETITMVRWECIKCCKDVPKCGGHNWWDPTKGKCVDPIAETFFVSATEYPDGMFVSSVDLFFKNKGELLPVEVQLRPVVNGVPSDTIIIPGATTTLDIEDIKVSNFPDVANNQTATRFTFPSPVYLSPSYEYAVVVLTDDIGYDYYSAELGGTIIGTDRKISKQPFMGSLFKSQNGRTWTPLQNEDLMFVLNRANFTASSGTAIFEEDKTALLKEISSNVAYNSFDDNKANTYYDALELRSDVIQLNNTKIDYYFKGAANSTKILDAAYTNFNPDKRFDLEQRNILFNPELKNQSMSVRLELTSFSSKVSPIVHHARQNMVTIENLINDTGLTADRFTITNPGINYDTDNAYITITSNVGYGANAWAVADPDSGNIVSIIVDSVGVGYVDDVIATIGGGAGTGAKLSISTETGSSGGPAIARYISKTVTLLDGFDAGDLRVFLTAIKPPGSNVNVYYKVRNALDPEKIEDRDWVRMTQKTSQYAFSVSRNPIEYEYRPSLTSNNITYSTDTTSYKTFNQYAIKIVLSSRSTVANSIPYVLDVRAIALPGDVY